MGVLAFFIAGVVLVGAGVIMWSRLESRDTKRIADALASVSKVMDRVESKLTEHQSRLDVLDSTVKNYNTQMFDHERKIESVTERLDKLDKKIDAVEHVARMPKSMNLKMSEPLKVQLLYKQVRPANKSVDKSREKLDAPRSKTFKKLRGQLEELSQ